MFNLSHTIFGGPIAHSMTHTILATKFELLSDKRKYRTTFTKAIQNNAYRYLAFKACSFLTRYVHGIIKGCQHAIKYSLMSQRCTTFNKPFFNGTVVFIIGIIYFEQETTFADKINDKLSTQLTLNVYTIQRLLLLKFNVILQRNCASLFAVSL